MIRIRSQKEADGLADMNLTSAIPGTDCGAGRRKGRVGWLIAAGILAAALLGLLVLTLALNLLASLTARKAGKER